MSNDRPFRYFSLEEAVVRELIGRRLVGKTRRDMDDISKRTMVPLASGRRQFDNLCAVMKTIEESPSNLFTLVKRKFLLPPELIRCYVGALFLNHHQIDVNSQPTVEGIALDVVLECTNAIIRCWSVDKCSLAFDPAIAHDMRDLKAALWNTQSEWTNIILNRVSEDMKMRLASAESVIVRIIQSALQIGSGLVNTREVRDLLVDIVDSMSFPLMHDIGLKNDADLTEFFQSLQHVPPLATNLVQNHPRVIRSFSSLMMGLSQCSQIIISDLTPK